VPAATRIHAWADDPWPLWRIIPDPSRGLSLVTQLSKIAPAHMGKPLRSRVVSVSTATDRDWQRFRVAGLTSILFLRPVPLADAVVDAQTS
jgi:hypothetical protein